MRRAILTTKNAHLKEINTTVGGMTQGNAIKNLSAGKARITTKNTCDIPSRRSTPSLGVLRCPITEFHSIKDTQSFSCVTSSPQMYNANIAIHLPPHGKLRAPPATFDWFSCCKTPYIAVYALQSWRICSLHPVSREQNSQFAFFFALTINNSQSQSFCG